MKPVFSQKYAGDILALLAGGGLVLAFAPYSVFPLAVLFPALLFWLWQSLSPWQAFWRGWLFGVGLFGVGVSWVHISFHQFGGLPFAASIALTTLFVLFLALYPALLGGLLTRFFPDKTFSKWVLILPATWALMEWVRGWLFTGFPWLSLGYSQIDSPLNGFAPLLGVYGVSWMTVLTASLLAHAFNSLERVGHILLVLVGVWGSGELLSKVSWTTKVDEPLEVALVQGNISQEFKWLSGYQIPSIERYLQLSQEHHDADLIIWPETAIPIFYHDATEFLQRLAARHMAYGTHFLIGVPVMNNEGAYFNGVASIGEQPGFYYKHHLVPFGEYIPFQSYLGELFKLFEVPLSEFSAGSVHQLYLRSAGQNIGVSICYEDAFGEQVRNSLPAATLLVNVSNDAWFGNSIAPHQHLEIARMRALENGRYLLRATNTGISAVIDAKGQVTAQAPQFEIVVLRDKVQPYQGITPYAYFGNGLIVILLFSSLLLGGFIEHSRLVRRSQ